jgi:dihydrofolate reductase
MKIKVFIGTSLDGFIARRNGDIDWLTSFANEEAVRAYEEFIADIDAHVIGRGTFEKVLEFPDWPFHREVFVLSNSLKSIPDNLMGKASILAIRPPAEVVAFLEAKGFKNAYIDGGKVIQDFLRANLIDEVTISHVPVLIGDGIPLFGLLDSDIALTHLATQVYSNGLVRTKYERRR